MAAAGSLLGTPTRNPLFEGGPRTVAASGPFEMVLANRHPRIATEGVAAYGQKQHVERLHIPIDGEHRSDLIVNAGRVAMSSVGRAAAASRGRGPFTGRSSRCRRGELR